MGKTIDITGQTFGRWTVLSHVGRSSRSRQSLWRCRCDCGVERVVTGPSLRAGKSRSCGCLQRETTAKRQTKHGHDTRSNQSPIYRIWNSMRQRCSNPNVDGYEYYGGRGVKVCERWNSFENFLSDMGERPEGMSLDRIDPDGDYTPDNCRWVGFREQVRNRGMISANDLAFLKALTAPVVFTFRRQ